MTTRTKHILGTSTALLALWALSWGLSSIALGAWSLPCALAIALVKAALVVLVFMEAARLKPSARVAAGSAVLMLCVLGAFVLFDVVSRGH